MATEHLLYKNIYPISGLLNLYIPTVGEVIDHEDAYYDIVLAITAMPIDFMVQLDDIGIDYTKINAWQLFLMLFDGIKKMDKEDTKLVFGNLNLDNLEIVTNPEDGKYVIVDRRIGIVMDRALHARLATALRKIHHLKKNNRRPANKEAKAYMLERARIKLKNRRNKKEDSQLEPLIVAMVNTEQFKYDFEGTRELSIYQFNESVQQIIKKTDYDNRMYGVYAGTVNPKELSKDDLNWLIH